MNSPNLYSIIGAFECKVLNFVCWQSRTGLEALRYVKYDILSLVARYQHYYGKHGDPRLNQSPSFSYS